MTNPPLILIPTDNSRDAKTSLEEGIALAELVKGKVVAVSVITSKEDKPDDRDVGPGEAESGLNLAAVLGKQHGVNVETRTLKGDPVDQIEDVIEDVNPDLVIMGTQGRHGISRFLFGSVTEGVIRKKHCPVLVYTRFSQKPFASSLRSGMGLFIMATTDGSNDSIKGVEEAFQWAVRLKSRLHLLSIVDDDYRSTWGDSLNTIFMKSTTEGGKQNVKVTHQVDEGDDVVQILKQAQVHDADLIVMSTHGRGVGEWLLGSTTREVFLRSTVPVMVVPARS